MNNFKLNQEVQKNAESVAEMEGIIDLALKLKVSDGHRILNSLLIGYLQQPFEEDDPEILDEIDQVAVFCEIIGRQLQNVNMSHLE
jgi:hypothetical protein